MVIPKLTPSPSIINFEVVGPCSGTAWQMSVACPELLTGFSSSVVAETSVEACELTETVTYYNASLADTPGTVGLYDLVFADAYGSTPLTAGFYLASGSITGGNDWFEVSSAGVVVALGLCSPVSYSCDGFCYDPGDGSGTYATLEECEAACGAPATAEINYSLTLENGATGQFDLYINGVIQQTRTTTSTGIWIVNEGDVINVELTAVGCTAPNIKANAICTGIITDSNCADNSTSLFTAGYTVTNADLGTILTLDTVSRCDTVCI